MFWDVVKTVSLSMRGVTASRGSLETRGPILYSMLEASYVSSLLVERGAHHFRAWFWTSPCWSPKAFSMPSTSLVLVLESWAR